jgi:hypothetical protein
MRARKLTEDFYEALKKGGAHSPVQFQVEEAVGIGMKDMVQSAAGVAKKTHKLGHIDTCRCKRCREADKIEAAVLKLLGEV